MTRQNNLADLFELVAEAVPERLALVAGDERRTYAELDGNANRLARHLADGGVGPGAKVAIYAWNRVEWVEAMLAAYKLRAVPININYRYVADELRYVLENADVEAVVFERAFAPIIEEVRGSLPLLQQLVMLDDGSDAMAPEGTISYADALAGHSGDALRIARSADDLYMLYTGGTTGMPKGVMWRHEDIFFAALMGGGAFRGAPITTAEEIVDAITPEDGRPVAMAIAPIMHGAAQWGMLVALLAGGTVVLYSEHGFDPHSVWRTVEAERCNAVMVVGDAMARPLAESLAEPGTSYDTSSVFTVGSGGAVFSPAVKAQLVEQLGDVLVVDSFGASEMGATGVVADPDAGPQFMMNESMAVLDEDLRPVEPGSGTVGKVARRGHIPLGYYKDESKTAATFVTDPDGVRWVIPGDFAMLEADGTISVLGRGSGCITTGGEKVYPEEVEAVLKSHPDVFDALVVGVPDERFTERVAAVVAPREGRTPTLESLAAHCRTHVAGYKVPRELRLADAIARTPAGKPDYAWAKSLLT
jgi:acyl-CoA synthetase (AMP-forming)/AMP-acid ligase II